MPRRMKRSGWPAGHTGRHEYRSSHMPTSFLSLALRRIGNACPLHIWLEPSSRSEGTPKPFNFFHSADHSAGSDIHTSSGLRLGRRTRGKRPRLFKKFEIQTLIFVQTLDGRQDSSHLMSHMLTRLAEHKLVGISPDWKDPKPLKKPAPPRYHAHQGNTWLPRQTVLREKY